MPSVENLYSSFDTLAARLSNEVVLAAALTFCSPFAAPSRFKLFFNLSRVDIVVETFFSN